MFTGIIEEVGKVEEIRVDGGNLDLLVRAALSKELKVDQSVAHNGVCLTVVEVAEGWHRVTAVEETLRRSNLGALHAGDGVNLERCLRVGDRLDGHMVQGHVDTMVRCMGMKDLGGSWSFSFSMPAQQELLVPKGSICINGVSLTIAGWEEDRFSVAIIPYTHAHTTFATLRVGELVNLEYDVLGKYVQRMLEKRSKLDEPAPQQRPPV